MDDRLVQPRILGRCPRHIAPYIGSGMAFDSPTSDRKSQSHEGRTLQTVGFHNAPLRFDKALFPYRLYSSQAPRSKDVAQQQRPYLPSAIEKFVALCESIVVAIATIRSQVARARPGSLRSGALS